MKATILQVILSLAFNLKIIFQLLLGKLLELVLNILVQLYILQVKTTCHLLFVEALNVHEWREAIFEEMRALENNATWEKVALPQGKTVVGCKWIFTVKYNYDGSLGSTSFYITRTLHFKEKYPCRPDRTWVWIWNPYPIIHGYNRILHDDNREIVHFNTVD